MGFMKPKGQDTSKQDALIAKQEKDLESQKKQATLEADRQRDLRVSAQKTGRLRRSGRSSLIKTGSELGTSTKLG